MFLNDQKVFKRRSIVWDNFLESEKDSKAERNSTYVAKRRNPAPNLKTVSGITRRWGNPMLPEARQFLFDGVLGKLLHRELSTVVEGCVVIKVLSPTLSLMMNSMSKCHQMVPDCH